MYLFTYFTFTYSFHWNNLGLFQVFKKSRKNKYTLLGNDKRRKGLTTLNSSKTKWIGPSFLLPSFLRFLGSHLQFRRSQASRCLPASSERNNAVMRPRCLASTEISSIQCHELYQMNHNALTRHPSVH